MNWHTKNINYGLLATSMHPQRKLMICSDVTQKKKDINVSPLPLTQEMISKKYSVNNDKVLHTNQIATFIQTTT